MTNMRLSRWLVLLLIIPGLLLWFSQLHSKFTYGVDFYPLYFAAERILDGGSPYGVEATNELGLVWDAVFAKAGVAYPLPLIMLVVPLTTVSFPLAASLWTLIGFISSYACVILSRVQSRLRHEPAFYQMLSLLIPFTFWPFFRAVGASQATLVWFGLAVILVFSIRRNLAWVVAICVVLLVLKPQNGILFALYGAYWLFRHHRSKLVFAVVLGTIFLGFSLAMQPTWISEWLSQVKLYNSIVKPSTLLPLGLVVLLVVWRFKFEWWAKLAIIQVILFPLSDIYSTLPLLLAWCAFSPPLALVGTSLSWLWVFFPVPVSLAMVWLLLLMPLLVTIIWEGRPNQLRSTHIPSASKQEPVIQGTP